MPQTTNPEKPEKTHDPVGGFIRHVILHPYSAVAIVTLTVMGIGAVIKHDSAWDHTGIAVSRLLLDGKDFYVLEKSFTYPPFEAWFNIPFTWMPSRSARAIWYVISAACLVYLVWKSWRLAGGQRLEPVGTRPMLEHGAFLVGLVCALQFALNSLTHLQTDLLIGAMLVYGCGALARGRAFRAATWIGLAAAFKCTPLLFAPFLAWRGKWWAAIWLVAVAIGANLLPDTLHSPPGGGTWLAEWYQLYLAPMKQSDYLPGNWKNQLDNNQAIAGASKRWLMTTWRAAPGEFHVYDRATHPSPPVIRAAYIAGCLAVLLPAIAAFFKRRASERLDSAGDSVGALSQDPPPPDPLMLECGIIMLLMLLLSPNSSRAHFCIMLLPAFCLGRTAFATRSAALVTLLTLAALFSTLSIHIRLNVTMTIEQLMLWVGVVMLSAIFLLWGSILALIGARRLSASRGVRIA